MSSHRIANENVMEDYMSALLTEDPILEDIQRPPAEPMLEPAEIPKVDFFVKSVDPAETLLPIAEVSEPQLEKERITDRLLKQVIKPVIPENEFQVLLFEVAGLTLAVPLTELGGIHKIESIDLLFGKPDWLKGILLHRGETFNVVDTAKWVMSEKSAEKLSGSVKYNYLIVLGESGWGLGCESLITTETLLPDDVKWRNVEASRSWLSGMVKKKMCALLNVKQLINMFNEGLSSND